MNIGMLTCDNPWAKGKEGINNTFYKKNRFGVEDSKQIFRCLKFISKFQSWKNNNT